MYYLNVIHHTYYTKIETSISKYISDINYAKGTFSYLKLNFHIPVDPQKFTKTVTDSIDSYVQ